MRRAAPLLRVRQLWRWHGIPVAVDEAFLPADEFDGLDARWLRGSSGVYQALQQRFGIRLKVLCEQFRAVMLPREESALLGVTGMVAEVPALSLVRISGSMDGAPLEWRQRYCLTHNCLYRPPSLKRRAFEAVSPDWRAAKTGRGRSSFARIPGHIAPRYSWCGMSGNDGHPAITTTEPLKRAVSKRTVCCVTSWF